MFRPTRILQKYPRAYRWLFEAVTTNSDQRAQSRSREKYGSRFGGMWTDRSDFRDQLAAKNLSPDDAQTAMKWARDGYVIYRGAIRHTEIDNYLSDIEVRAQDPQNRLRITTAAEPTPVPYTEATQQALVGSRLVDDYFYSDASRALLLHPKIRHFLNLVFERAGVLTQSLRFDYGSQQAIHQDTGFVRMNAPMKLAAVWIALEDIRAGSGELIFYPGSHRWEGFLFSGEFKHYDAARDGPEQLALWHQWILHEAERRKAEPETFDARKGDILFWHAGLAHGGARVAPENLDKTRKSLVGHYCPEGVRPLYHYYKPRQRRFYGVPGSRYTSRYYK